MGLESKEYSEIPSGFESIANINATKSNQNKAFENINDFEEQMTKPNPMSFSTNNGVMVIVDENGDLYWRDFSKSEDSYPIEDLKNLGYSEGSYFVPWSNAYDQWQHNAEDKAA